MAQHVHRTAVFALHNPPKYVCSILDNAFTNYTEAYTIILNRFSHFTAEEIRAMATYAVDDNNVPRLSDKQLIKNLFGAKHPDIQQVLEKIESGMRESLYKDVAGTLLSYQELFFTQKNQPSFPSRLEFQDVEPQRLVALHSLSTLADDIDEERELTALLQQSSQKTFVPISFCRIEAERNCGLFYNPETRTFYARLFVITSKSKQERMITCAGKYIDIVSGEIYVRAEDAKGKKELQSFGTGKRSVLVPLEMGGFHEEALRFTQTAYLGQRYGDIASAKPVSARLVKKEESYQLHVSFRFPKPERIKTETLFGVDRGINCLAAGFIVSKDGKEIIEEFIASGKELRDLQIARENILKKKQERGKTTKGERKRGRIADQHIHICANQIVEVALQHKAQIVMEDLSNFATRKKREKFQRRSNFNHLLGRRQYQKLQDLVNMKLELVGLPPVRTVSASFTSQTCTNCGHISNENRSKEDRTIFCCEKCKYEGHADSLAGINIARKIHWLALRSQEKKKEIPEKERTPWGTFVVNFISSCKN